MRATSPESVALRRARAAAVFARLTGSGIGEAAEAAAAGAAADARPPGGDGPARALPRRGVLTAAGISVLAAATAAVPGEARARTRAAAGRQPRIVIIGSGLAGLGCAYRLWQRHGIASDVYEFNADQPGGRISTLRGFFKHGQYSERHAEFISSEHTQVRRLAASLGLTLDNVNRIVPGTRDGADRLRFGHRFWSQAGLDRDWHQWGYRLFTDAAFRKAPWPTLYNSHTAWARRWDHMPAPDWIDRYIPGGLAGDFGRLCVSLLQEEYGGPVDQQSALNLVYLLGLDGSTADGHQPKSSPALAGTDEKWHIRGGTDQLISRLLRRLPAGTVRLGERLVAVRTRGHGRYACTISSGAATRDVIADHVVLALPFTRLREVQLRGIGLPPLQRRAIAEQPLGSNAKIAMQFTRRAWIADHWSGLVNTDEVVQGGWAATADQRGPAGILIALPGGATGADLGPRYGLTSYHGPAPAGLVRDYLACFERDFPGVRAAYAGKTYYVWSAGDPHIGGAYSYLKTGQYTAFNGIQGRRHGNLHFAGEHTSLEFQGFMEGALQTGYRCAAEIAGR